MNKINGLVAASLTPIGINDVLNLDIVGSYSEYLSTQNISGVFINGSTGDFTNLSAKERNSLVEEWGMNLKKSTSYIVHVGGSSINEVMEMAAHAQKNKMNAISTVGTYFFKPRDIKDLIKYCAKVSSAAPELPFYYYHIPQLTGLSFDMVNFCHQAKREIPSFAGIKYSSTDLIEFRKCLKLNDSEFEILFGHDENLLAAYSLGARGFVGSTYNYLSQLNDQLISAVENGDLILGSELQSIAIQIIEILASYGYHGASKSIMKLLGLDFGICRLPHKTLSPQSEQKMIQELEGKGLISYLNVPYG